MKSFLGVLAALILVAGGVYGLQTVNAGDQCCAAKTANASTAKATADKGEAKVEAANATAATATTTTSATCDASAKTANATAANVTTTTASAGCCASKTAAVNAEHATAGAQCTYNAKTASVACTGGEVMTAEACMAKLSHCGIDVRKADAQVLAAKLVNGHCGSYTQEQWATMIKSAQALDAKQADVIFANATSEKKEECTGCPLPEGSQGNGGCAERREKGIHQLSRWN